MPPDSQFFAFCLIAAVLTVTPGADTLLVGLGLRLATSESG